MSVIWLAAAVLFGITEAVTAQLVSIWFVGGAVCALVASLFDTSVLLQIGVFAVSSAILLIFTRSFVKKLTRNKNFATNIDALIGQNAVITRRTDGINGGEAKLDGKLWTVYPSGAETFDEGDRVRVERIEGVKLIVSSVD